MSTSVELLPAQNKGVITEWMSAEDLKKSKILRPGDLIEFKRFCYRHWAIMKDDDDTIIHFSGEPKYKSNAKIIEGSLTETAGTSRVRINNSGDEQHERIYNFFDTCDKMVERACSRIGTCSYVDGKHSKYNVVFNNCEHFATYSRYGIPSTGQTNMIYQLLYLIIPPPDTENLPNNLRKFLDERSLLPLNEKTPDLIVDDTGLFLQFLKANDEYIQIFALRIFANVGKYRKLNDDLITELLKDNIFMGFLHPDHNDTIHQVALSVIACIAIGQDKHKQDMIKLRLIHHLIELLDSRDIMTVTLSVVILICFSYGEEEQARAFIDAGAIPELTKLLNKFISEDIVGYILAIFINIAEYKTFDKVLITYLNGILEFLEYHFVQQRILGLFRILADGPEKSEVISIGVNFVKQITDLLESRDPGTAHLAALVLQKIASEKKEQAQAIIDAGAIPYLVDLLESDTIVCESSLCALGTIVCHFEDCTFLMETGILNNYAKLIKHQKTGIQKKALALLDRIWEGDDIQKTSVCNANIIPSLIECLESSDLSVAELATSLLGKIVIWKKEIAGAIPKMLKLFDSNQDDVFRSALKTLTNIACGTTERKQIIVDEVIPKLVDLLNPSSSNICKNILWSLTEMAQFKIYNSALSRRSLLQKIHECVNPLLNDGIQKEALQFVREISAGDFNQKQAIIVAQFIPTLVSFLDSKDSEIILHLIAILANISSERRDQAAVVVSAGGHLKLMEIGKSETHADEVRRMANQAVAVIYIRLSSQ